MAATNNSGIDCVPVAVIMIPYPPQGHFNPLLHLSRLISAYRIPLHFASIPSAITRAKAHVRGWNPTSKISSNIYFHELNVPSNSIVGSDPSDKNKSYVVNKALPLFKALMNLRDPVYDLARILSVTTRKLVVIYDSMMPYVVQDIRFISNVESYCFETGSAFASFVHFSPNKGALKNEVIQRVPPFGECVPPEAGEIGKVIYESPKFESGYIYNTSRVIEGVYVDLLVPEKKRIWAIGPVNMMNINVSTNKCLDWLDEQEPRSAIFISFGTTSSMSHEQIGELALGLESSGHKFIWVLKDAVDMNVDENEAEATVGRRNIPLPYMFEERVVEERKQGLIVRDWAPQLEILGHKSTGGFISHCGWNSCVESISHGIPMGTWPMGFDQPANAVLITEVLKIGVQVREFGRRDQVLSSFEVEKAVRKLMESAEGEELRKRAAELRDAVKNSGASHEEMDSFIAYITK